MKDHLRAYRPVQLGCSFLHSLPLVKADSNQEHRVDLQTVVDAAAVVVEDAVVAASSVHARVAPEVAYVSHHH